MLPEFIALSTHEAMDRARHIMMRMTNGFPDTDIVVNMAIDVVNGNYVTKLPLEVVAKRVVLETHFDWEPDADHYTEALVVLASGLRDIFAVNNLFTDKGVPYRFWRTVNDDCILQHTASTTRPPADAYRQESLQGYIPPSLP